MLKRALGWVLPLSTGRVLAFCLTVAAATYAIVFRDPFVFLFMTPFFALGCRRGTNPIALIALSLLPATLLVIASAIKFSLVGVPLVTYDHYFLRKNIVILAYNDWRLALSLVIGAVITVLYVKTLVFGRGAFSRFERGGLTALVLISAASLMNLHGQAYAAVWESAANIPTLETFVKSSQVPRPQLRLEANGETAEEELTDAKLLAPSGGLPDIFLVLEESTFPPSLLQSHYKSEALFAKGAPQSGPLRVHTFAGGTWRTEFSVAIQMKPQEFGSDGLYVFHQLEGRIKRSLFTELKALGYRTMIFYPVPGSFINASAFYATIGIDEFYEPRTLGIGTGWDWKFPDSQLYDAMLKKVEGSKQPVVALLVTINQHGPHNIEDPMADYVARFADSDKAYKSFLESLARRDRRAGVIAFGDHQPEFTARFLDGVQPRFFTAYEIRCINFGCSGSTTPEIKALDATLLAPSALQRFGFELDGLSLMQQHIFATCEANVDACEPATQMKYNTAFAPFFD